MANLGTSDVLGLQFPEAQAPVIHTNGFTAIHPAHAALVTPRSRNKMRPYSHSANPKGITGSSLLNEMSLIICNLQRTIPLRRVPLRKKIEQLRYILGVQKFDLGVICVSNKYIQRLNKIYKGKNIPTDVLSFPFHENLNTGQLPHPCTQDEYSLGDIFLGVEYIYQHCEEYKENYDNVLTVTVAHGMCHLLGYKHHTKADWLQMYEKEMQVLQELNKLSGTNLQPLTKNHF